MNTPVPRSSVADSAREKNPVMETRWTLEPSLRQVLSLSALTCVLFVSFISLCRNYAATVDTFGDSAAYMVLASAIRRWDFQGIVVKQFWGLPYAMAALSELTRCSDRTALLLVSFASSFFAVVLADSLWGGWVAGFFAVLSFDWMQRSFLGGSEPLFVALLFGSFLLVRKERWLSGALLASLATVVRPMGFLVLLGIGLALLRKRDYRTLLLAIAIGATVGALYVIPLARHFGDPLATVNSYHSKEWQGGWLFGFPFYAIIKGTVLEPAPVTNLLLSFSWILLVLVAIVMMVRRASFREYAMNHPVETVFLIPYLWMLYAYNYPHWARGNFVRFAIPIVPFVLLALDRWVPKDRRVLWLLGVVTPILAAASAIGIINFIRF
jgi:hypothetical protein